QNPSALDGVADAGALTQRLARMQRLYRVAPRYQHTRALLDGGLDSARSIVRVGRAGFMQRYGSQLGGPGAAAQVYERAARASATALTLLAQYGAEFNKTPIAALAPPSIQPAADIPDWETLFGSLELCACEHCRSVYSPAAYLVDVLHFLYPDPRCTDGAAAPAGPSAKDILFRRRPDLGEIELTCENTNTPVPYVDLVNEVLEQCVAPL